MKKDWRLYAHHIIDCINKIKRIKSRGDIDSHTVLKIIDQHLMTLETAIVDMLQNSTFPKNG